MLKSKIKFLFCSVHMPSILLMGHPQTVQNQTRCSRSRRLIRFSTVCLHNVLFRIKMKNTTQQPLNRKWTCSFDKAGKIHSAYGLCEIWYLSHIGDQRRFRQACTSAQSHRSLPCSPVQSKDVDSCANMVKV